MNNINQDKHPCLEKINEEEIGVVDGSINETIMVKVPIFECKKTGVTIHNQEEWDKHKEECCS